MKTEATGGDTHAARRNIRFPIFERDDYFTSPEMAAPRRFIAATGMCIADGVNQSEDGTLASRNALLNMIQLLMERGWSREQAYCICSVAVDLKVSEVIVTLHVSFRALKGEAARRNIRFPIFERDDYFTSPEMAAPRRFIAATGMCIADGVNQSEDGTLASRNALLNMIQLLMERGWSREQAYCICSVAVDLKVSEVVDVPNFVVSAFLPLDIFED